MACILRHDFSLESPENEVEHLAVSLVLVGNYDAFLVVRHVDGFALDVVEGWHVHAVARVQNHVHKHVGVSQLVLRRVVLEEVQRADLFCDFIVGANVYIFSEDGRHKLESFFALDDADVLLMIGLFWHSFEVFPLSEENLFAPQDLSNWVGLSQEGSFFVEALVDLNDSQILNEGQNFVWVLIVLCLDELKEFSCRVPSVADSLLEYVFVVWFQGVPAKWFLHLNSLSFFGKQVCEPVIQINSA